MALSENDIELIEKYLDQGLTDAEKILFDEQIISSEEFKSQFEIAKSTLSALKEDNNSRIKEELKVVYKASKAERSDKYKRKIYWIAASIFFLSLSSILYWYSMPNISNQETYLTYYEVYPALPNVRGNNEGLMISAMDYYRNENYKEALALFSKNYKDNSPSDLILIYMGNCYLNLNETENAIVFFKKGQGSDDLIIKQTSNWYLALSYLKSQRPNECLILLNKIVTNNELYTKEASSLIEELQ